MAPLDFNNLDEPLIPPNAWRVHRDAQPAPEWLTRGAPGHEAEAPAEDDGEHGAEGEQPEQTKAEPVHEAAPEAPASGDGKARDRRERYVRTDDVKRAVQGRGAEVLHALGIMWHNSGPDHIRCPFHSPDNDPSWRWDESKGCCFCTCDITGKDIFSIVERREGLDFEHAKIHVAELLGRADLIHEPGSDSGVTLQELADAKKLPLEFLRGLGWSDLPKSGKYHNKAAIRIPYTDSQNRNLWARIRIKLSGKGKDRWRKGDAEKYGPAPLYGAHMAHGLKQDGYAVIVEGETDSVTCWHNSIPALGLPGAGNWNEEAHAHLFDEVPVIFVVIERDTGGASVLRWLAKSRIRSRVRLVYMPEGVKDPSELWCRNPDKTTFAAAFRACLATAEPWDEAKHGVEKSTPTSGNTAVSYEHFYAYMPDHRYIFIPDGTTWPASSINSRLPGVETSDGEMPASEVLDKTRPVEQMTWLPGAPVIIKDKIVRDGGWIAHPGANVFNRYRAPIIEPGDQSRVQPWLDHLMRIYPDDAPHIIKWCAHRVRFPGVKINHALVLGGTPGIGKDTMLQPVKYAIGLWNFREITAPQAIEPNNDFLQSVILLISEARDGGKKVSPYQFFEQTKVFIASPPDTLRINEKYIREYIIFNLTGVVITTNNRTNGLFLTEDDRRHYVAWSESRKEEFADDYWDDLYGWYAAEGDRNVAAYLMQYDLAGFNPKAPPPKTKAFWDMVDANRAPEQGELADVLDRLGRPPAVTLAMMVAEAEKFDGGLSAWLQDRGNRRTVPHRLSECGYVAVRNPDSEQGLWRAGIPSRRIAIYAQDALSIRDQVVAARTLIQNGWA